MIGKRITLITGIVLAFAVTSCEGLLDLGLEIDTDTTTVEFTVLPTDVTGEQIFATSIVDSELDSTLAENDLTLDELTSVKLKEATIELLNEDETVNFDFFECLEATIEVDGLPETVIAVADSIPAGARKITCKVMPEELLPFLEHNQYTLRAKGVSTAPINDTLYIKGQLKFAIHAPASDLAE
ncbi:MAG: hypothetical protein ACOC2F_01600 [Bacteroidota bacterium]